MSDLREQLQAMQREYAAAKYPGDLAADVLRPRRQVLFRIGAAGAALTGIAAAVLVWIGTQKAPTVDAPSQQVAVLPQPPDEMQAVMPNQSAPADPADALALTETVAVTETIADAGEDLAAVPLASPLGEGTFMAEESLMPSGMSLELPEIPSVSAFDVQITTTTTTEEESV